MRVLHIYSGNLYGGIEAFLLTLARHEAQAGSMRSEFALSFAGRLSDALSAAGASLHFLGESRLRRPWSVFLARRRLKQLLARGKYDVVVCHAPWSQALFGSASARAGIPLVFWQHDAAGSRSWTEFGAARCRPDFVICNSEFTRSTLPKLYADVRSIVCHYPVETAPPALEPHERVALRRELGADESTVVIIQTSRMQSWKGQLQHLRALSRLRDLPQWISVQVGGPQRPSEREYFEEVVDTARRLGVAERVRFLGQRSDVPRLLAAADVHCQPNLGPEPFGIAFIEALAAGLPVVTMNIGGAREIVTPEVGFLADDEAKLADALRAVIMDEGLRRRMAAAAPARAVALCNPVEQIRSLGRALEQLVATSR